MEPTVSPAAPAPGAAPSDSGGAYLALLCGIGSWFGFWGSHAVIFQWLIVDALGAPAAQVGTAQMALTLPSLLFLVVGGVIADRLDASRVLVGIHLATAVLVAGFCALLALGWLSLPLLIAYAVLLGTLQAFGFPARDSLLSDVVRGSMSRAVAGTTLSQHLAQVLGAFLAGFASLVGAVPVLAALSALVGAGAIPLSLLPPSTRTASRAPLSLVELRAGIAEVAASPVLRPVIILAIATGLLFVGPYLVILPLMVRDVYGGGAAELAVLNAMFPLGSVLGGLAIVWRGGLRHNGRALALGQLSASAFIATIACALPFAGTVLAVLGWGVSGALFINAGRTLFQSHASEAHRARVLSVYTLGVMGAAPLGSLASGLLAGRFGLHASLGLVAALSVSVTLAVATTTSLWRLR